MPMVNGKKFPTPKKARWLLKRLRRKSKGKPAKMVKAELCTNNGYCSSSRKGLTTEDIGTS
jgi:hypothetical protein